MTRTDEMCDQDKFTQVVIKVSLLLDEMPDKAHTALLSNERHADHIVEVPGEGTVCMYILST